MGWRTRSLRSTTRRSFTSAPDDLGREVVETWEWLVDDARFSVTAPSPTPVMPPHRWRLEVEDGGFAMDLPDHWWPTYAHGVVGGEWADATARVLDGPLSRWVALVGPSSGCGVLTGTADADTAKAVLAGLDVAGATPLDLPAGPAVRIGPMRIGPTSQPLDAEADVNGQAAYVIASASRLAIIECAGMVPADGWLPVAQAFAFLPPED